MARLNAFFSPQPTHFSASAVMRFVPASRWKQFSLGSLFVLLTFSCVVFGWWSNRAHGQRDAVADILRLGGQVAYRGEVWHDFRRTSWTPTWLKKLLGRDNFDPVTIIWLSGDDIHDSDLACFEALPDVEELWLRGSISDSGLEHLRGMKKLMELNLYGPGITDAGLIKLRRLSELRSLTFHDSRITDAGLKELADHHKLQDLHIYFRNATSPITDAGIRELKKMKSLTWLIIDVQTVGEGITGDLQRVLPQCDVWIHSHAEDE
jgi:hypothetical protein